MDDNSMVVECCDAQSTSLTKRKKSRQEYEKKRVQKHVSLLRVEDAPIIDIIQRNSFDFSGWVKSLLGSFSKAEIILLDENISAIPSILIERAIEMETFDLDQYLKERGKKIVDIKPASSTEHETQDDYMDVEY